MRVHRIQLSNEGDSSFELLDVEDGLVEVIGPFELHDILGEGRIGGDLGHVLETPGPRIDRGFVEDSERAV